MITTSELCDLIIGYFHNTKTFFWATLFNVFDDGGDYQFYYMKPGGYDKEKHAVFITTTNLLKSRIIDQKTGTPTRKWIRAIKNCQSAFLKNIRKTIYLITDENSIAGLHDRLHALCIENDMAGYPGAAENANMNQLRDECIEMVFILFMKSIGTDMDNSDIAKTSQKEGLSSSEIKPTIKKEDYFFQTLYTAANEEIISIGQNPDYFEKGFSGMDNHRRILIEGPGGQGKSLFLKMLEEKALENKNHYEHVLRIELTELVSLSDREISDSKDRCILCYLCKHKAANKEYRSFLRARETLSHNRTPGKTLLLLDGLNELYASSDFKKVSAISDELEYINKNWDDATIIMTTRPDWDNRKAINGYLHCKLSGTPKDKLNAFLSGNKDLGTEIKALAEIPMYYNVLAKLKNIEEVKTKYDLLFRLYSERFNQSAKDGDSFFAFYVLAPYIAQAIHDNPDNKIGMSEALTIVKKLKKTNYELLLRVTLDECGMGGVIYEPDVSHACSILFHNGPVKYIADKDHGLFVFSNNKYKIFHDDIRDFLLAFRAIITIKALRASLDIGQFDFIKDIYLNLNLKDEPIELIKSKLSVHTGKDIEQKLSGLYSVLNEFPITPQLIIFAHTLFLISDYLNLGETAVEPTHRILIGFTERVVRLIRQNNFPYSVDDNDNSCSDLQRCIDAMSDIISKHCEYYRRNEMFVEGIELTDIAECIQSDNDAVTNQKGKLLLLMYQSHLKDSKEYELSKLGFNNYTELYFESRRILNKAVQHRFGLSVNLVAMIYCTPAPFLFEDKSNQVAFDFIKAFDLYRSLIFTNQKTKEISYAVRQAVGLLIKGYVRFNPDFEKYEKGNPGENSVVIGSRNTCLLDADSLNLAMELLDKVKGISLHTLNYYRGVVSFFNGDIFSAEKHFENESDPLLKSIFRHYQLNKETDLDNLYRDIARNMEKAKGGAIDSCHPIYWYCDAKNLELSFNKERRTFFQEFEKKLPETWKNIVKQLTQ